MFQNPIVSSPAEIRSSAAPEARFAPRRSGAWRATILRGDDDHREDEEDCARAVHPQLARVERRERAEPRESEHREGEDEPRPDRGRMNDPRARGSLAGRSLGRRLGKERPDRGGDDAESGREEPDLREAIGSEDELAEDRADREPGPEAEAVEAQSLAAAVLGSKVGDDRRRADEDHRLPEPREQAKRDQELERAGERVGGDTRRRDERAGDDEDATALPVPDATGDRLREEDHRADGADRERDAEAARAEVVVDVHGQDHEQHPDRHAGRELREDREDERLREDAIGLHVPIQPEPGTPTRIGGRTDGAE